MQIGPVEYCAVSQWSSGCETGDAGKGVGRDTILLLREIGAIDGWVVSRSGSPTRLSPIGTRVTPPPRRAQIGCRPRRGREHAGSSHVEF